jgi:REP element-mobilizing transposase RayT
MPQSLSKVYLHIIFSTKKRYPFIDKEIEQELWSYISGICKEFECDTINVGGYNDHIHICCLLSRKITQIKLLEEIKKRSSRWIKTKGEQYENFHWQDGYAVFSVNPSKVEKLVTYINDQHKHHESLTYQQELLTSLKKHDIKYDEHYLWD